MPKNTKKRKSTKTQPSSLIGRVKAWPVNFWRRGLWQKLSLIVLAVAFIVITIMYSIAQWYIFSHRNDKLVFGATFIPAYARSFDMDPQETLSAMINDLGLRRFRLVSYWDEFEKAPGQYDFSDLDWQFDMIEKSGGKVSLALGLRQPRWPECHMPEWAANMTMEQWAPKLKTYIGKVVERYRNHPALDSYQLENEFFLTAFGICPDHTRSRLVDEFNFVKSLDPDTTLIVTRSNNALGWPAGEPIADLSGVSVYKRVWDKTLTKRYFEYPFPAWFYGTLAGWNQLMNDGNNTFIHELQAEAWLPGGSMKDAPIDELYKSMNPKRLRDRINYGVASGMKTIDLWGVEWWYHMKAERNAPELWDTAKATMAEHTARN